MYFDLAWPWPDVNEWPWPEVKIWPWPLQVKKHMFWFVPVRVTWRFHRWCSIFIGLKAIRKKIFHKTVILTVVDLWRLNHWTQFIFFFTEIRGMKSSRAIYCFLPCLTSYHSSWDNCTYSGNIMEYLMQNLIFDDLWWPQYWFERKNDRSSFLNVLVESFRMPLTPSFQPSCFSRKSGWSFYQLASLQFVRLILNFLENLTA